MFNFGDLLHPARKKIEGKLPANIPLRIIHHPYERDTFMTNRENINRGTNLLLIAASLVVIVWGIYQAQSFLVLMLVALFLSVISAPLVLWLKQKHIPSVLCGFDRACRHGRHTVDDRRSCWYINRKFFR